MTKITRVRVRLMTKMKKWVTKLEKHKCKIPYQPVVGDKEVENNEVNVAMDHKIKKLLKR